MTSTTATSTGYVVDRTGSPRFINRTAATAWLATATDGRALQCPDCTEIHDDTDTAFDCCRTGAALPVRPVVGDPDLFETVPADQLTETEPSATATDSEPAASTTPGYSSRLRIWFTTTGSGRRTAWYYSWPAQRAIRVSVADAELWLAADLADRSCGHPLKPHAHPHAEV